jgi:uncharacterized membrane protein YdjX (TVP38/TMEM64 family)
MGSASASPSTSSNAGSARLLRWITWCSLLLTVLAIIKYGDGVLALRGGLQSMGAIGIVAFVLLEAAWTMTTLPSAPVMTMGGMLYGFWLGSMYALVGNLLGSAASFWLGRAVLSRRVEIWAERYDDLRRALELVESRPFFSVLASRISSAFPLTLLGYALGTTRVPLTVYLVATFIAVLPGAVMYAGIGDGLWIGFARANHGLHLGLAGVLLLCAAVYIAYRRRSARPTAVVIRETDARSAVAEDAGEHAARGEVSTQALHAAAGGRGRRATA